MVDGEEDLRFRFLRHVNSTLVGIASLALPLFPADSTNTPQQTRILSTYVRLPLAFEANYGQVDPNVKFVAHGAGSPVLLKTGEIVITRPRTSTGPGSAVRMKFLGANPCEHPSDLFLVVLDRRQKDLEGQLPAVPGGKVQVNHCLPFNQALSCCSNYVPNAQL